MIVITIIYSLLLIYVILCLFSTDILFLGKKARDMFTYDITGNINQNSILNNSPKCLKIEDCIEYHEYYSQYRRRLNKENNINEDI